jgi:RHS repeat-associated protein
MRWLVLFAFALRVFANPFDEVTPSAPEEIASLNADLLVDGFVSAASGQISLAQSDLHIKGAQDLILQRTYVPPQILGRYDDKDERDRLALGKALYQLYARGWVVLPHLWAGYNRNSPYFQVRDPHGTVLEFQIIGNRGHLKTSGYGCSNLRGGEPSAEADIRNIEFLVEGTQVIVSWPNGTKRIYQAQFAGLYRLESELLPNGKAIRYSYNNQGLARVFSTDASGKYTYAAIDRVGDQHYRGSDGREAKLLYETREIKGKFKKDGYKETATFQFPVLTSASNPSYSNSAGYNDRTLLTSYDAKNYPISCIYWQQKGSPCRVQNFSTPSGSTSFTYDPPIGGQKGGSTTVTHPNGSQTIYRFNLQFLLSAIENWYEGKLYNQKLFSYDSKQHISKIETKDGQGHTLLTKTYECDQAGNPILEKWEGDFGLFSIERAFSKNRVVKEVYSDGLAFEYTYLGDTHLITSKVTLSEGTQFRKTEYLYDDACNLIEEREVGKTITAYVLYQEGPHLHRPEWKVEKDWKGRLIHKTRFVYDRFGHVTEEIHYGSDDALAYRTTRLYDSHDNLLEETNPLTQVASYSYDARGRQVKEVPFAQNKIIQRSFDSKGRLITLQEGDHTTRFAYNSSDELIQKTDYLGLETQYRYHPVHGKPVWIAEDPTLLEITYDDFGREIARKDAYGATTTTQPNSYGDPLIIVRPDGGREVFCYAPNRTLLSRINPDGLKTSYTYDPLKRMLSKTVGTRKTIYTYDAYNLLKEKDPLGASTCYEYNLSGQKIKETRGDRVTQFSYDPLGFLAKTERGVRSTTYQNDVLGRVVSKSVDGRLDTSYTYDPAGNIASITKQDTIRFLYDPYDRLIEKVDAEGAKTTISYEEGNRLLKKTTQDPKGAKRIEIYNAHGLLLKKEVPGCTLEEYTYDRALRLASQDHLTFTYTPEGFRSSLSEAKQRTTFWTYTPGGKIQTKVKPDGTVLRYEYTEDGDLARVGSREFQYDALGRIIRGTGFSREYDLFDNVIKEELATGLIIRTFYDDFDRPVQRVLPDQSFILYEYEGPLLIKMSRLNTKGDLLYTHTYDQFDLNGHVLSETGLFNCCYRYDRAGRRTLQTSPFFNEELAYDEAGNLIRKGAHLYAYDGADQLISSSGQFSLTYDKHYNRQAQNGDWSGIDELNQIEGLIFNENGCLVQEGFAFDEFDQLTQANGEMIGYDALGRRIQKGKTSYLYFGDEEVGAFENGQAKELKIPGLLAPIALEIDNKPHYPIADVQGTIRILIDPKTAKVSRENSCDPFGAGLSSEIPYAYAGKRYDAGTGLVYFGKRYYVPNLGRWLTPDPVGPLNHSNLYQYLFNNPYLYQDDNGEFAFAIPLLFWGAELALPTISACITAITYTAAAGAVAYGGYKLVETFNDRGYPSMGDYYSGDLTPGLDNWSYSTMKSGSGTNLPANPDDLSKRPGWKETTHPDAGKKGHRTFENEKTGEIIRHDQGKPGQPGHKAQDHYHHQVPNGKGGYNYVDGKGNPVPPGSNQAHLYPNTTK